MVCGGEAFSIVRSSSANSGIQYAVIAPKVAVVSVWTIVCDIMEYLCLPARSLGTSSVRSPLTTVERTAQQPEVARWGRSVQQEVQVQRRA